MAMLQRAERALIKQCPQCAWDAEGRLVDEGGGPPKYPHKGKVAPPTYQFDCGNCGYQWKVSGRV